MEQIKAMNALEPFLALTKSASSPRAAADLITRATSAPNTFIFAELLSTPQIQSLSTSPEHSSHLTLLQIFSYGTYTTYHSSSTPLPPLNEAQTLKLRQLSLLTLAKNQSNLTYDSLLGNLGLDTPRELEDLVISAIYAGLLNAQLDPYHKLVAVSSIAPLRDLQPNSIPSMLLTLSAWSTRCTSTLSDIERQIASIKSNAKARHREEEEWASHVDKLLDTKIVDNSNGNGKGKEKEGNNEDKGLVGIGNALLSRIPKLGAGAASKRGAADADRDDEAMEVDDEDEEGGGGERRGSRSAKKRGFGLLGSGK